MRDGLIHYSGYLAQSVAGFFLIPFLNRNLSNEDYGLWVFATSAAVFPALFDFGLFWAVTRSVSQGRSLPTEEARALSIKFVHNAGRVYGIIGLLGGLGLLLVSGPLSQSLKLTHIPPRIVFGVFIFTALNFVTEELMAYGSAVLQGLRRFDLTNIARAFTVIVRSVGIAVVVIHLRNMNSSNGMHAAVIWNLIGGIAGGGKGAGIGALAGAGAGTAIAASKKGEQISIPSESLLEFRLQQPAPLPVSR